MAFDKITRGEKLSTLKLAVVQYAILALILALSAESRAEVDDIVEKAIAAGGRQTLDPQDHGWMYQRSFEDINGHQWEFAYMDEAALAAQGGQP